MVQMSKQKMTKMNKNNKAKPVSKTKTNHKIHFFVKDMKMMWLALIVLVVCCAWGGYKAHMYYTQARYQLPGRIYAVKLNKNSKLVKQALTLDGQDAVTKRRNKASLTKPSYLVFAKSSESVAVVNTKAKAEKLAGHDQDIKKASDGLTYEAGKNNVDFKVKFKVDNQAKGPYKASVPVFSGDNLKFHQASDHKDVKGDWSYTLFGVNMKLSSDTLNVYRVD